MPNSNIELLKEVAKRLGPLLSEVVFVGGCTTGLFITDAAAANVRPTFDVDVIAEITSYADYATFSERLRALGFREDTSKGAPLCRWLIDGMNASVRTVLELNIRKMLYATVAGAGGRSAKSRRSCST